MREILHERDRAKEAAAAVVARSALLALRSAGYPAHLVGSLARGEFRSHSDIDLLIDASGPGRDHAICVSLRALAGHPSSIVFMEDVPPHALPHFLKEAADGPCIRGY